MKITKYQSGKKSYDFVIDKRTFAGLISSAAERDDKTGCWWLVATDGKSIKLIVEKNSK